MKRFKKQIAVFLSVLFILSAASGAACKKKKPYDPFEPDPQPAKLFKADYGFTKDSVTKEELGLGPKEYYWQNFHHVNCYLYDYSKDYSYDELVTKLAIEGMMNRKEAILFLDRSDYQGGKEYNVGAVGLWPDIYGDPNRQGLVKKDLSYGFPTLIKTFAKYFNGIILYTTDFTQRNPSTNFVLALNLANANFCIPVRKDIYYANKEHFGGLKLVADISDVGLTQDETYEWILRNIYRKKDVKGLVNKHTVHSLSLNFPDNRQAGGWHNVNGIDYAFSEKVAMFNLAPSKASTTMYGNPVYATAKTEQQVNAFLANLDSSAMPAPIIGWNEREPDWAEKVSEFGHYLDCTAAAGNVAFHSAVDTVRDKAELMANGMKQKNQVDYNKTYENGKTYIAFLTNEGDAMKTRTLMYNQAWNYKDTRTGAQRGSFPVSWAINPVHFKQVPAIMEYYYDSATLNDQFYGAPTGGAGYCNLAVNPDIDRYVAQANKYLNLLDIHYADFWYSNAPTINKLVNGTNLKGVTLDANPSYGAGGFNWFGANKDVPGLRYKANNFYWQTQSDPATGIGTYVDSRNGYDLQADEFFREFSRTKVPGQPVFLPFYSMEADLLMQFYNKVILDPRWQTANVEVVDLGTLVMLAGKYQKTLGGEGPDLDDDAWENLTPKFTEQMNTASSWVPGNGVITTEGDGRLSYKVTNPAGWGLMEIYYTHVPRDATSLTVNLTRAIMDGETARQDPTLSAVIKMTADWNNNGVLERENNTEVQWVQAQSNTLTIKFNNMSVNAARKGYFFGIEIGYVGHMPGNFIRINSIVFGGAAEAGDLPRFDTPALTDSSYWSNPDLNVSAGNGASYSVTPEGLKVNITGWGVVAHTGVVPVTTAGFKVVVSGSAGVMIDLKFALPNGKAAFFHDYNDSSNKITGPGHKLTYYLRWTDLKAVGDDAEALLQLDEWALAGSGAFEITLGGSFLTPQSSGYIVFEEMTMISEDDYNEMQSPFFSGSLMSEPGLWTMYNGGYLVPNQSGGGFTIVNDKESWELASIAKKIPTDAKWIKMKFGAVNCSDFVIKIHGDLDGFGIEDSWYRQGKPEEGLVLYYKIDPRILSNIRYPFKVQLGFAGGTGSLEYLEFEFITDAQYNAESGESELVIGDPDKVLDDGDLYNIDRNNDGIRDGDQLKSVGNLKVSGGVLTFDTVEEASLYMIEVYDASGSLFKMRQTVTGSINLSFIGADGDYVIKVYATAPYKYDSEPAEITVKYAR